MLKRTVFLGLSLLSMPAFAAPIIDGATFNFPPVDWWGVYESPGNNKVCERDTHGTSCTVEPGDYLWRHYVDNRVSEKGNVTIQMNDPVEPMPPANAITSINIERHSRFCHPFNTDIVAALIDDDYVRPEWAFEVVHGTEGDLYCEATCPSGIAISGTCGAHHPFEEAEVLASMHPGNLTRGRFVSEGNYNGWGCYIPTFTDYHMQLVVTANVVCLVVE